MIKARTTLRTTIEQVADGTYKSAQQQQSEQLPVPIPAAPEPRTPIRRPGPNDNPFPDQPLPAWLPMKEPPADKRKRS